MTAIGAGLLAGVLVAAVAPWSHGPETTDGAAVETRVAGISVERSSVDDEVTTTTAVATLPGPTSTAAPTTTAAPPETAPPETAPPVTASRVTAAPTSTPESVRSQVLAQIAFPWQEVLPGWEIEFMPARKGYRGSTFPDRKLIQIYLRDELTIADYVHVTAHELGHAVDVTLLDDADHERWNETRGRAVDADWWVASGADDFSSGAGDWAECFSWSQLPSGRFYSRVAGAPTAVQLAVMADIVTGAMQ